MQFVQGSNQAQLFHGKTSLSVVLLYFPMMSWCSTVHPFFSPLEWLSSSASHLNRHPSVERLVMKKSDGVESSFMSLLTVCNEVGGWKLTANLNT